MTESIGEAAFHRVADFIYLNFQIVFHFGYVQTITFYSASYYEF